MILGDNIDYDPVIFEWGFDPITIAKFHQKTKNFRFTYKKVTAVKETDKSYIIKLHLNSGRNVTFEIKKEKLKIHSRNYKLDKLLG